jgi:hypothetical protein
VEAFLAADDADDTEADDTEADDSASVAPPPPARRPGRAARAAKGRPSRRRAEAQPAPEPASELGPMLEIEEAEAEPTDVVHPEPVTDAEPRLTIEMPPPSRTPARARRRSRGTPARQSGAASIDAPAAPIALSPKVWVIPGRSRYHTQDCRFAKGDTLREVTEATAQRRGYVACNVCKPGS